MADWTTLSNQAVGVGGLPSGTTVTALRDNPVAIAEGATGAPLISGALTKVIEGEEIGAFVFAHRSTATSYGDIVAGSSLSYSSAAKTLTANAPAEMRGVSFDAGDGATLSGSWRCLGEIDPSASYNYFDGTSVVSGTGSLTSATLFQRVA